MHLNICHFDLISRHKIFIYMIRDQTGRRFGLLWWNREIKTKSEGWTVCGGLWNLRWRWRRKESTYGSGGVCSVCVCMCGGAWNTYATLRIRTHAHSLVQSNYAVILLNSSSLLSTCFRVFPPAANATKYHTQRSIIITSPTHHLIVLFFIWFNLWKGKM